MNFDELFGLTMSPWELVLRGSAMYWFLFAIFRFVMRRDVGSIAIADVLLLVLIADASQNAMGGDYKTITEGCVLVATLVGWNFLLDWASFRFALVRRLVQPRPLVLVDRGRVLRHNLRSEHVSVEELMVKLREKGIDDLAKVRTARMESDGEISVIEQPDGEPKSTQSDDTSRPKI